MSTPMMCQCDESFTCSMHQRQIDQELATDRLQNKIDWCAAAIQKIAAHMGLDVGEPE